MCDDLFTGNHLVTVRTLNIPLKIFVVLVVQHALRREELFLSPKHFLLRRLPPQRAPHHLHFTRLGAHIPAANPPPLRLGLCKQMWLENE